MVAALSLGKNATVNMLSVGHLSNYVKDAIQ
jgi:hypothetical protein